MKVLTRRLIDKFRQHLVEEEKTAATLEKYMRDIEAFSQWLRGRRIDKKIVLEYKEHLVRNYAPSSVNSVISSLNSFFIFNEWYLFKVKGVKIQKQIFASSEKELTKSEYERLLTVAQKKKNERLYLLMQTICSTGIRVSELKYITVEAIVRQRATINCKGKMRIVILPKQLCSMLVRYVRRKKITAGSVFQTKSGKPLDRSNIWSDMKNLCREAGVSRDKVFPHNLRHLFARTYYSVQRDIVRLADILGHSSINTTRIYTMETGEIHRQQIQKLGLLRC